MSVVKSLRHETKSNFKVADEADKLAAYVFTITNNEKIIPKRHRFTIATSMHNSVIKISSLITMANNYRLDDEEEAKRRLRLQREAIIHTHELEKLSMVEHENIKSFSNHTSDTLGGHIDTVRNLLNYWIRSDKQRKTKNTNNCFNTPG